MSDRDLSPKGPLVPPGFVDVLPGPCVVLQLHWRDPVPVDDRHLLHVGALQVGAVFERRKTGERYTRWRVWVTKNMHSVEGYAVSVAAAKAAVEARVREALALMTMVPA